MHNKTGRPIGVFKDLGTLEQEIKRLLSEQGMFPCAEKIAAWAKLAPSWMDQHMPKMGLLGAAFSFIYWVEDQARHKRSNAKRNYDAHERQVQYIMATEGCTKEESEKRKKEKEEERKVFARHIGTGELLEFKTLHKAAEWLVKEEGGIVQNAKCRILYNIKHQKVNAHGYIFFKKKFT